MLVSCWSTKGGVGTSVVAASLGLLLARRSAAGALLVDLAGDLPAVLGTSVDATAVPGVAEWLRSAPEVPPDGLGRLELPVGADGLGLLTAGSGPLAASGAPLLAVLLREERRPVVVDCGRVDTVEGEVGRVLAKASDRSVLVTRACYVGLRRAAAAPIRPTTAVVVLDDGRSITSADVEVALGVRVGGELRVTDSIARAVDAGLLACRLPRSLERDLADVC